MSEDQSTELDFLADGSMRELAMKMDLIDQQLADLTDASSSNIKTDTSNIVGAIAEYSTADFDVDVDADAEALTSLQDELREVQEAADHDKEEVAASNTPTPPAEAPKDSSPAVDKAVPPPSAVETAPPAGPSSTIFLDGKKYNRLVVAAAKPEPTSKVGISMKTSKGHTLIVAINSDGLMHGKGLKEGHKLMKVNGIEVKNARHARVLIQSAATKVSVEVLEDVEGES